MQTWLTSYADAAFLSALKRLTASAPLHGIGEVRAWGREALERTTLYQTHRDVLDKMRGGGYWLWKPFIIEETMKEAAPGALVVYSDAGVEIVADLHPLFDICREKTSGIMVFASPYERGSVPGRPCSQWTKRDCFVDMRCDEPYYYEGQTIDASFIVLHNTPRVREFVSEWFDWCRQSHLLTDVPNIRGLPNLPDFVAHRHDQSILSLLARRERFDLFRQPSQHGNHLKIEAYREPGEWTHDPYGSKGLFENSPYKTLLRHHRGNLGQAGLSVDLDRTLPARRDDVFQSWTNPGVLRKWLVMDHPVVAADVDLRVGGAYTLEVAMEKPTRVTGTYLEVQPPERLVFTWMGKTRVTVEFAERGDATAVTLRHEGFDNEKQIAYHARGWQHLCDTVASELR